MKTQQPVAYVPGRMGIVDVMGKGEDGVLRSKITGETIEDLGKRYPGVIVGDLEAVAMATEQAMIRPPTRITRDKFIEMLEVLPPEDWQQRRGAAGVPSSESFKLVEYFSGNITSIYARIGGEYFEMLDRGTLSHEQIVEKCKSTTKESSDA
jgi:hypothetical protein